MSRLPVAFRYGDTPGFWLLEPGLTCAKLGRWDGGFSDAD
jgi:hypothetical protein